MLHLEQAARAPAAGGFNAEQTVDKPEALSYIDCHLSTRARSSARIERRTTNP